MQPLAAGGLRKGDEAQMFEAIPHLARGLDHGREGDVRSRIEIEHEASRDLGLSRPTVGGMEFGRPHLGQGREPFHALERQIGLVISVHGHQRQQSRRPPASRDAGRNARHRCRRGVRTREQGRAPTCGII